MRTKREIREQIEIYMEANKNIYNAISETTINSTKDIFKTALKIGEYAIQELKWVLGEENEPR